MKYDCRMISVQSYKVIQSECLWIFDFVIIIVTPDKMNVIRAVNVFRHHGCITVFFIVFFFLIFQWPGLFARSGSRYFTFICLNAGKKISANWNNLWTFCGKCSKKDFGKFLFWKNFRGNFRFFLSQRLLFSSKHFCHFTPSFRTGRLGIDSNRSDHGLVQITSFK